MNRYRATFSNFACGQRAMWILCFLGLALFAPEYVAQDQWDAYQPRKLSQIIELNHPRLVEFKSPVVLLTGDSFPSRVKVVYTGKSRAIPKQKVEVISAWATGRQVDRKIVDLIEKEMLFTENSVEHWLAVQKQLLPYFEQEVKVGESLELFVIWIGARKQGKREDWVFLVNEFAHVGNNPTPSTKHILTVSAKYYK